MLIYQRVYHRVTQLWEITIRYSTKLEESRNSGETSRLSDAQHWVPRICDRKTVLFNWCFMGFNGFSWDSIVFVLWDFVVFEWVKMVFMFYFFS